MTAEEMLNEIDFECIFEDYDSIHYERDGEYTITFYKLEKAMIVPESAMEDYYKRMKEIENKNT